MSKTRTGAPARWARSARKASNISFQAAACTLAVWVSTPSRSNRQAVMPSGTWGRLTALTVPVAPAPGRPRRPASSPQVAHGTTLGGELVAEAGVGDGDERRRALPDAAAPQLGHAVLGY